MIGFVNASSINVNLQAQLPVVTDGAGHYYSPIQRNFGGFFWEDITDLDGSIRVYANGTMVTNYAIRGPGLAFRERPSWDCISHGTHRHRRR